MPAPAWLSGSMLLDAGLGILGATGQAATNRANRQMARESMRFSERMSSTAAQRSVKDYAAAGLNPALAYDRPASSPGGTMAQMGDSIGAGISSAQSGRRARIELQELQSTQKAQRAALAAQATLSAAQADKAWSETSLSNQQLKFQEALQPFMQQKAAAEAALLQYAMPEAKANARVWEGLGVGGVAAQAIGRVLGSVAGPAARLIRPPVIRRK